MKIQITFTYNNVKYRKTINEHEIDMEHYDDIWDTWFGENDNELANRYYEDKDDETELVFEVTADKKCVNDKYGLYVICGEDMYINVYPNSYADDYCDQINTDEIEVLYT